MRERSHRLRPAPVSFLRQLLESGERVLRASHLRFQRFLPGAVGRNVASNAALNEVELAILTGKRLSLFHIAQKTQR